jgi:CTP-dependent riboflavin kinase
MVPKRGNKKRKIIELIAINLKSKLNLRGNRFA